MHNELVDDRAVKRSFEAFVVGLCTYEAAAILTGRTPTVSALCKRYRLLEAALLAAWLTELHYERKLDEARTDELARCRAGYRLLRYSRRIPSPRAG